MSEEKELTKAVKQLRSEVRFTVWISGNPTYRAIWPKGMQIPMVLELNRVVHKHLDKIPKAHLHFIARANMVGEVQPPKPRASKKGGVVK